MKNVYIAHQVLLSDLYCDRVDEEGVFTSYESAKEYIDSLVRSSPNKKELSIFRNRILEYFLDGKKSCLTRFWEFAIDGRLLKEWNGTTKASVVNDFDKFDYEQKYSIGDIVYAQGKIDNIYSKFIEGTYGIVIETPVAKEIWLADGNSQRAWDGCYIVDYITPFGGIEHEHIPECALEKIKAEQLPDTFFILKEYSDHIKGIKLFPDNLNLNDVYVKKTKNYYSRTARLYFKNPTNDYSRIPYYRVFPLRPDRKPARFYSLIISIFDSMVKVWKKSISR